jgi:hypothetical protein
MILLFWRSGYVNMQLEQGIETLSFALLVLQALAKEALSVNLPGMSYGVGL